ncbi:polyketide cyclase [Salinicola sp. CPA57]|uniref:polyketide cyclase n=1 Tax=Salinicola sp. CPA57 TaxID=1949080 RepID=UPI000DA1BEB3|nr:polyketide cyclase [Salinicola sp. CPA57]
MHDAITISLTVECPWQSVYEAFWRPEAFPLWASGLSQSRLSQQGERWLAKGPEGSVLIRFTGHNPYGVMDHWVELASGEVVYVPLRIIANDGGAEVQLTLFRRPGMDEATFERDTDWVRQDLLALKTLSETSILSG